MGGAGAWQEGRETSHGDREDASAEADRGSNCGFQERVMSQRRGASAVPNGKEFRHDGEEKPLLIVVHQLKAREFELCVFSDGSFFVDFPSSFLKRSL